MARYDAKFLGGDAGTKAPTSPTSPILSLKRHATANIFASEQRPPISGARGAILARGARA